MNKFRHLIVKWRKEAEKSSGPGRVVLLNCADELEAKLSENDRHRGEKPETD